MNIVISDAAWFVEERNWETQLGTLLIELLQHPSHSVDADAGVMIKWCEGRIPLYAEELRALLLRSNPRANACEVTVHPDGSALLAGPPPWCLTASAALPLIRQPLRLFLENDDADWSFLCSVATCIAGLKTRAALEVMHGGGSELKRKIVDVGADDMKKWRSFFLFDSDRLHPSELDSGWRTPSGDGCEGYQFQVACTIANIPSTRWHMLRRRSIENYLPQRVLEIEKPDCASVLFSANIGEMLYFYNMKDGLEGDGIWPPNPRKPVRSRRSQSRWDALSADEKNSLRAGFGKNIADKFKSLPKNQSWDAEILAEGVVIASALLDAI